MIMRKITVCNVQYMLISIYKNIQLYLKYKAELLFRKIQYKPEDKMYLSLK